MLIRFSLTLVFCTLFHGILGFQIKSIPEQAATAIKLLEPRGTDRSLHVVRDHDRFFLVFTDTRNREQRVILPGGFSEVLRVERGPSGKATVIVRTTGSSYQAIIVDMLGARTVDLFDCLLPSVSPDGRYIAFVKFFPSHFVTDAEWHYMMYDLKKTPAQNRPPNIQVSDTVTVGWPLFPVGIGNAPGDNVNLNRAVHVAAMDSFFWSNDSSRLVFADRFEDTFSVVMVQLSANSAPSVRQVRISSSELCANVKNSRCDLQLQSATFDDKRGMLLARFRGVRFDAAVSESLDLNYYRFQ
jgi:hypothetical protein